MTFFWQNDDLATGQGISFEQPIFLDGQSL